MSKLKHKLMSSLLVGSGGFVAFCSFAFWKNDERFYKNMLMPLVHKLEPETSHRLAILTSKWMPGFLMQSHAKDDDILKTKLWNQTFSNPIGLAAGFDKDGEVVPAMFRMGFGFVEVGSVTPQPQPGNPKPRLFRLSEDKAVINRYGFNSVGHQQVKMNLTETAKREGILAVNLGQNKSTAEAWTDYAEGVREFGPTADFLVINVSSPNTPGLRNLQKKKALEFLIEKVLQARNTLEPSRRQIPIIVKIAPDVTQEELKDIAEVIVEKKIDGIVISNTTLARPESLKSSLKKEMGGLSGRPLTQMSTDMIRQMYILTKGKVPIIGVGGVECGSDAYNKIRSGASLIELYTAMVYQGPPVVDRIKNELTNLLKSDGFNSVSEAVGTDSKV